MNRTVLHIFTKRSPILPFRYPISQCCSITSIGRCVCLLHLDPPALTKLNPIVFGKYSYQAQLDRVWCGDIHCSIFSDWVPFTGIHKIFKNMPFYPVLRPGWIRILIRNSDPDPDPASEIEL